jgi:N-acetylmuramoyl-L-alanine amidase
VVHSLNDSAQLKSQLLRDAVQENTDMIAGRLPAALRPARRLVTDWTPRVWLLPVPFSIVVGLALVGQRATAAVQSVTIQTASIAAVPTPAPLAEELTASAPDVSVLARPFRSRALGLGVRRIVLDPGHGGDNLGTASASGLQEKDVTLDLVDRARKLLLQQGFEVVLTRTTDGTLSLKERATIAKQHRGDIFVSVHLNSLEPASVRGIETFYLGPSENPEHETIAAAENENSGYSLADMRTLLDGIYVDARRDESKRLARSVQDAVLGRLKKSDPAMRDRGVKTAPFVVLVATDMPAILAEVSCLSNAAEAERLGTNDYRQTIAEALVTGIRSFADQHPTTLGKGRTNE